MTTSRTQQLRDHIIAEIEAGATQEKDLHKSVPKELSNLYNDAAGLKAAIKAIWDDENMGSEEFQDGVYQAAANLAAAAQAKIKRAKDAAYDRAMSVQRSAKETFDYAQHAARDGAHYVSDAIPDRESLNRYYRKTKQGSKDALPLIVLAGVIGYVIGTTCRHSRHDD